MTFTFLTGALGAPVTATYSTGNVAVPIPDNSTVDVPIVITDTGVVSDVERPRPPEPHVRRRSRDEPREPRGNRRASRRKPRRQRRELRHGANDCSGTPTVFDDGAATAISAGTAPFAGTFRPEAPLSALNGELVTGTWKLRVTDTAAPGHGTVGCVSLELTRQRFVCCGVAGTPQIASGGATTFVSENFAPANSVPDPAETFTASFPLLNIGDGNTANLVATLQNSGGVSPITTTQNYGVVLAAGPVVSRPFTFIGSGPCGGTITATLHLQDGALDLGNVTFTFTLGTASISSMTFSNTTLITIPATGTGATTGAPATPYPSNITVSGVPVTGLSRVTVTLTGYSHAVPGRRGPPPREPDGREDDRRVRRRLRHGRRERHAHAGRRGGFGSPRRETAS